jgi:hypothetical protein
MNDGMERSAIYQGNSSQTFKEFQSPSSTPKPIVPRDKTAELAAAGPLIVIIGIGTPGAPTKNLLEYEIDKAGRGTKADAKISTGLNDTILLQP